MPREISTEVVNFIARITSFGYHVYVAENNDYGFITDVTERRVLNWSFSGCCWRLSGSYGPASTQSGTGWVMDQGPEYLTTRQRVQECLYAEAPSWTGHNGRGWTKYTTVKEHLAIYQRSSRFRRVGV